MVSCVAPTMRVGVAISPRRGVTSQSMIRPPTLNSLGALHQIVELVIEAGKRAYDILRPLFQSTDMLTVEFFVDKLEVGWVLEITRFLISLKESTNVARI